MFKNPLLVRGGFILETLENSIFVSNTKDMNYNNILTESRNAITYITINRPKQLNALNAETITELNTAILAAEKDKLVRCIIITGAENKAFIAGADIKEFANYSKKEGEEPPGLRFIGFMRRQSGRRSCRGDVAPGGLACSMALQPPSRVAAAGMP